MSIAPILMSTRTLYSLQDMHLPRPAAPSPGTTATGPSPGPAVYVMYDDGLHRITASVDLPIEARTTRETVARPSLSVLA